MRGIVFLGGRKLELHLYDSRTDNGGDQAAYVKGCDQDFAMVASMSAFDSGGAKTASDCGIPDVRAIATTTERAACSTCYAAQPAGPSAFQKAVPNFLKRHGVSKAGMLYITIGASATNGESQAKHGEGMGLNYVVKQPVDVAAFNYGPYVQSLKSKGAESVQFIASSAQFARLATAMTQGSYIPVQYSDFIFATAGEELGFVGSTILLLFEGVLIWQALAVAGAARDMFGRLIAVGIAAMFMCHMLVNAGMNMSIMPITGIPLPFISYGGSFTMAALAAIGLLQSVALHRRRIMF